MVWAITSETHEKEMARAVKTRSDKFVSALKAKPSFGRVGWESGKDS